MSDRWLRASEIPNYLYCRRAWWLKRMRQVKPQNVRELETGTRHHQTHGRVVWQSIWAKRTAVVVLLIVVAFFAYQLLLRNP